MTKTALAQRAGLSTRILTAYERGEREPSEDTVRRLAAALEFPAGFFFGDDIDEPAVEGVSFRALSSMTAQQQARARGAAAIGVVIDEWIRARFELPTPDVPRLRGERSEAAADAVRLAWGMGWRRAPNMIHLLESRGVRVFSLVEDCAEVDAFSFWRHGVPYVFLNTMKTPERSRMDAAHELGHLVMHSWGGPRGRAAEEEAQAFAAAFLMPTRSVVADAPVGGSVKQIIRAKTKWNVSAMALTRRMHELGLLSDWQARTAYIQLGKLGYRDGEPIGIDRENSQILHKVFDALRDEGLTRAAVARELKIPVEELNRAAFGLVAIDGGSESGAMAPEPIPEPRQLHVV